MNTLTYLSLIFLGLHFDLFIAATDLRKFNETFLAITAISDQYYLSVTNEEVVLLTTDKSNKKSTLKRIDSRLFSQVSTNFRFESHGIRLNYLDTKRMALLCTDNVDNKPECLLIPILTKPSFRLGQLIPVNNDYRKQSRMNIWNVYRVISEDGNIMITAYLNATESYETSWIIRQELSKENNFITTGLASDHQLARLYRPHNNSRNVYAFQYQGYAYFLRYAYRYKFIEGKSYEWTWQLTRVCVNDKTKALRSRSSIPLTCSFPVNPAESGLGWKPSIGYLNTKDDKLYLYIQPNVSTDDANDIRHRICSFDMVDIVNELQRTYTRCFEDYSHMVAIHGGGVSTKTCNVIQYYDQQFPCRKDICNPEECTVNPAYHTEVYEPVKGVLNAVIDFRYQSQSDIDSLDHGLSEMYITQSGTEVEQKTVQAFVRNAVGSISMIFINGNTHGDIVPQAPAWVKESPSGTALDQYLLELPNHDGTQLIDVSESAAYVFTADCSLYSECNQLMQRGSGEQARRWWDCGWCVLPNTEYSSLEKSCVRASGQFHGSSCPPRADCYEPRHWNEEKEIALKITGNFPTQLGYHVVVCGSECKNPVIQEQQLTCTAFPPYHLDLKTPSSCSIQISVIDPSNNRVLFNLRPACSPAFPAVAGTEGGKGSTHRNWIIFTILSMLVVMAIFIYVFIRCRRRHRKRQLSGSSDPMTMSIETRQNNQYVVHGRDLVAMGNLTEFQIDPTVGENLPFIPFDSLNICSRIGQGHFGEVYKADYVPTDGIKITVAMKTLKRNTNSKQFLEEAKIMKDFNHPHVLSLIGISFNDETSPCIITPYMENGDVHSYISNKENSPTLYQLLQFGLEIADGMRYLQKKKCVHRDLAARNCMLDNKLRIKIADFGLSRDIYESNVYLTSQKNGEIPVAWLPLESIERGEFTLKSDIWSFGVVLWELMTRGVAPYAGLYGPGIIEHLKSGRRLEKPDHCPDGIYEIMRSCWLLEPLDRPDFLTLSQNLTSTIRILEQPQLRRVPPYYNIVQNVITTTL